MKNIKKKIAGVVLGCTIGVLSCLPVFAAGTSVSPYALSRSCQECGIGNVTTTTSRINEHIEKFSCSHGASPGEDVYNVYEVLERSSCDNCSYSSERTWHMHDRVSCPNNWVQK